MNYCKNWNNHIINFDLLYKLNLNNLYCLPKIVRLLLYINLFSNVNSSKKIIYGLSCLRMLSGIKPIICRSKLSISSLKLRKGTILGCKVILNKNKIYRFLDLFLFLIISQVKNFEKLKLSKNGFYVVKIENLSRFFQNYGHKSINQHLNMSMLINLNSKNNIFSKLFLSAIQFPIK